MFMRLSFIIVTVIYFHTPSLASLIVIDKDGATFRDQSNISKIKYKSTKRN